MNPRSSVEATIQRILTTINFDLNTKDRITALTEHLANMQTNFRLRSENRETEKKRRTYYVKSQKEAKQKNIKNLDTQISALEMAITKDTEELSNLNLFNDHIVPYLHPISKFVNKLKALLQQLDEWKATIDNALFEKINAALIEFEKIHIAEIKAVKIDPANIEESAKDLHILVSDFETRFNQEILSLINPLFEQHSNLHNPFGVTNEIDVFDADNDEQEIKREEKTQKMEKPKVKSSSSPIITPVIPMAQTVINLIENHPVQASPKVEPITNKKSPISIIDQFDPLSIAETTTSKDNASITFDLTSILIDIGKEEENSMIQEEAVNPPAQTPSPVSTTQKNESKQEADVVANINAPSQIPFVTQQTVAPQTSSPTLTATVIPIQPVAKERKSDPIVKSNKITTMYNTIVTCRNTIAADIDAGCNNINDRITNNEELEKEIKFQEAENTRIKNELFTSKDKRAHIPGLIKECELKIIKNKEAIVALEDSIETIRVDYNHLGVIAEQLLQFVHILKDQLPKYKNDLFPHAQFQEDIAEIEKMYDVFFEPKSKEYSDADLIVAKSEAVEKIVSFCQRQIDTGVYLPRDQLLAALQKAKKDIEDAKKDPIITLTEKIDEHLNNGIVQTIELYNGVIKTNPKILSQCDQIVQDFKTQIQSKPNQETRAKLLETALTGLLVQNDNIQLSQGPKYLTKDNNEIKLAANEKNLPNLYLAIMGKAKTQLSLAQNRHMHLKKLKDQLDNVKTFLASNTPEARQFAISKLKTLPEKSEHHTYIEKLRDWADDANEEAHLLELDRIDINNNLENLPQPKPSFASRLWNNKFTILGTLLGLAGGVALGFFTFGLTTIPLIIAAAGWGVGKGALFAIMGHFIDIALEPAKPGSMPPAAPALRANNPNVIGFNSADTHRALRSNANKLMNNSSNTGTKKLLTIDLPPSPPFIPMIKTQDKVAAENTTTNVSPMRRN